MKILKTQLLTTAMTLAGLLLGAQIPVSAQRATYRVNDRQVDQIISSIERRSDTFRSDMDTAMDHSRLDGSYTEDSVNAFVKDFEHATDDLRSNFNGHRAAAADIENVLRKAAIIEQFMRTNVRQQRVQQDWTLLKDDIRRLASAYHVIFNLNGRVLPPTVISSQRPYRVSDTQVESVLRRIESKSDTFRDRIDTALDRSQLNATQREDNINQLVKNFEESTDRLRSKFDGRTSVAMDVSDVLMRAARIDDFMRRNLRGKTAVQNTWLSLRSDLNMLSTYYNVGFNLDDRRSMPTYNAMGYK